MALLPLDTSNQPRDSNASGTTVPMGIASGQQEHDLYFPHGQEPRGIISDHAIGYDHRWKEATPFDPVSWRTLLYCCFLA